VVPQLFEFVLLPLDYRRKLIAVLPLALEEVLLALDLPAGLALVVPED